MARMGNRRVANWVLVGRYDRTRQLGRPGLEWEDNIKVDLQALGLGGTDWNTVAWG